MFMNRLERLKSVLDREGGLVSPDLTRPKPNITLVNKPNVELFTMWRSSDGAHRQIGRIRSVEQPGNVFMSDMCVGPENNIYVISHDANQVRVEVYTSDGQKIKSNFGNRLFHRKLKRSMLICRLGERRLAVYDDGDRAVKIIFDSEDLDTQFDMAERPDSMSSNIYGHLVFTHHTIEDNIVTVRNPINGYLMQSIRLTANPILDTPKSKYTADLKYSANYCYVQTAGDGSIVVLDRRRCTLSGYSSYGQLRYVHGEPGSGVSQFHDPIDVALDAFGNALVVDCKNDRIQRFSLDTGEGSAIITEVKRPLAVSYTEGRIYVLTTKELLLYTYDLA